MTGENGLSGTDALALMGNRGFGGYGDGGIFWILILFLFATMGGWGNGWGNNANGAVPYVQAGFDQQAVMSGINNLQTTVANGFANAEVAACNRTMNTMNSLNNGFNQLALAGVNGFNGVNAGLADLKYTVATENCADRQAISDGLRDVIANQTANTNAIIQSQQSGFQGIQDKLCQIEIDNLKAANEQLRQQLNMATLRESQTAQTAQLETAIRNACGCGCNTNTCCG